MKMYSSIATANHYAQIVTDEVKDNTKKVLKCVETGRLESQIHFDDGTNITVSGLFAYEINRRLRQEREDG